MTTLTVAAIVFRGLCSILCETFSTMGCLLALYPPFDGCFEDGVYDNFISLAVDFVPFIGRGDHSVMVTLLRRTFRIGSCYSTFISS